MAEKNNRIVHWIDRLNEWVGQGVAWLSFLLVLVVVADVFNRYVLSGAAAWVMELEWHLHALLFLLGAGYAFKHNRHVRVDLFINRFSQRDQGQVNFWGGILFLLPWSILLMVVGWSYAYESFLIDEGSAEANGLPNRWLIKFAIPLGGLLLFLQGVASVIRAWYHLRSESPESA